MLASSAHGQESQFIFDATGNLIVEASENTALPQILGQPQAQVVSPGALASFFVVAANTRDLIYQWRFNGSNIGGATNDALLLQNVGATNEGQYSVVLTNSSGSVTSAPAALLLDGDRDGLPDSWELANFGNLNQYPTGDSDSDGVSNRDEFLDDTNPTNSASVLFRLTVQSGGGLVTVTPSKLSYTNGEVVTLTATAFPPDIFHGWTGDTSSYSNTIALVMNSHKSVFAHQGSEILVWTNTASGDWQVAANWSPNFVPGPNDDVTINKSVTVTVNSAAACRGFTLGAQNVNSVITGTGTLTVHGDATWIFGAMTGGGRTVFEANATLTISNLSPVALTTRTLENGGTVLRTGAGTMNLNNAVITNRAGALFETRNSGTFSLIAGTPRFDNAGTFRKSVNTGNTSFGSSIAFNNSGAVEIQTGTLSLGGGGTHSGAFTVSAGTTLSFSGGTHTTSAGSSITGAGNLGFITTVATLAGLVNVTGTNTISSSSAANFTGNYICTNNTLVISATANFNGTGTVSPAFVILNGGTLSGSQVVRVLNQMTWPIGLMSGSGRTIILPGATLNIGNVSPVALTARTLENGGTAIFVGAANFNLNNCIITNRPGALFETRGSGDFALIGGSPRFDNAGTFRKSGDTTSTSFGSSIAFVNYGTVEIRSGILAANGGYFSAANALLNCAIGGTTGGTGYGRLQVAGTVTLNGALSVDLTNGFSPALNDSFTVLTAGTRNGAFNNFFYPSNEVTMQMSNTANSVIVRVTEVLVLPPPVLHIEQIAPVAARLYWSTNYPDFHLEYNPSLSTTNWSASALTPVVTSTNIVITNSMFGAQKYYRLSRVPALYTPPPPTLAIEQVSPSSVRLLWSAEDDRTFTLQSNTNLSSTNWVTVSPPPAILGWNNAVTNPISGTQKFYRLAWP